MLEKLETRNSSVNYKNCIRVRLGEKKVLDFYIKMADIMINYLTTNSKMPNDQCYKPYLKSLDLDGY